MCFVAADFSSRRSLSCRCRFQWAAGVKVCLVAAGAGRKCPEILLAAAALVRALGGARVTSCKSAKDRTGMSVTLEQARWLGRRWGCGPAEVEWRLHVCCFFLPPVQWVIP